MRINIQKSKFLTSKNHSRTKVAHLESILEFRQTTNIEKYLGFPLLSGRVKNSNFSFILDRINTRLAGWKGKLLSRADRVTLARSISSSMLIYTMQNLWVPKGVWDKIDSCINQFIWGGKGCHWVKWDKITQPRNRGGLRIRRSRYNNISMLEKHVWELLHHRHKL
jgi:hypothetical protein